MPEIRSEGLDVSAEEERYLRRAFRRFALPYLAGLVALVALAVFARPEAPASRATAEQLQSLVAEAASLRGALAELREELGEATRAAAGRIEALEDGVEGVSRELRARPVRTGSAALEGRLDHAHQRIGALEARLGELASGPDPAAAEPQDAPPAGPAFP